MLKAPDLIPVNLIYSIRPAQSLVVSSQLIVDYIADKIEQSVSIQQIFNEILRFFETEALCVGPSFISTQQRSDITEKLDGMSSNAKRSEAKVLGDVKESSNHYVNKNESLQRPKILGFRIICSGRLQISSFSKPAEKAESIEITRGVLPLNTFKSNIDFAQTDATNAYGTCGIKVWVNRGNSHCLTQAFHVWNRRFLPLAHATHLLSSHCEQPHDSNVYLDSLDAFRAFSSIG